MTVLCVISVKIYLGVVQNNICIVDPSVGFNYDIYINAGLDVCTSKEMWQEYINEFNKRCISGWEELSEQNALNFVYHNNLNRVKLLEYEDRLYGISGMANYSNMYLKEGSLYIGNKKLEVIHFAGGEWKDKGGGKIRFEMIKDEKARNYLIGLTKL